MKANEDNVGHAADFNDNQEEKSRPGAPVNSFLLKAETETESFTPALLGTGIDSIHIGDNFKEDDIPEENLF